MTTEVNVKQLAVDGTDFHIALHLKQWNTFYSHKFNGPGVRYELAISIASGDFVHYKGPYACVERNDIQIFRDGLKKTAIS